MAESVNPIECDTDSGCSKALAKHLRGNPAVYGFQTLVSQSSTAKDLQLITFEPEKKKEREFLTA